MSEPTLFEPVAIVGRACVLPGALSPAALWEAVVKGRDLVTRVPAERWRLALGHALCTPEAPQPDRTWSDRGGYVEGFEAIWNPHGFAVAAAELEGLDPLVHWTLHCAREALRETRAAGRVGAVFGNLGFPTAQMAAFCEQVWTGEGAVDPRNRFMSGGTAAMLERALALDAGSFCLDAACASSLYAIKLACDALHDGRADLMLAGAVQRADDLFLHIGFCALGALSKSGRSRPFHREADGLLPAEGAAFLALKRLADARRDGDTIHGVIRGIGLSNDGRGKGLLAPSEAGQARAIGAAYAVSGVAPEQVSLLECHATGTPVGDATELRSSADVFAQARDLPIGSLKSNLGHLITVAGAAGLIKLLEAMRAGVRPPTLHCEDANPALQQTPFRLLREAEPWTSDGPRIAAISAFGFGGNNAHLIVSEDDGRIDGQRAAAAACPVAIVGIGVKIGDVPDRAAFTRALFDARAARDDDMDSDTRAPREGRMASFELDMDGLRFPPRDLEQALPQQLVLLAAACEALAETTPLPRERSAALIGLEPDPEIARHGARWRLTNGRDDDWAARARATLVPALEAAAVLGSMPNIPANRLSSQFDLGGPSFTLQSGAASGTQALRIAARGLACGELDAAIVGAVDFGCEAVQRAASGKVPGDAAVALVLKRLDDAQRNGDRIYALVDEVFVAAASSTTEAPPSRLGSLLRERFGYAQAAFGLVETAAAALALHHRRDADGDPWLSAAPRRAVNLLEATAHPRRAEHAVARLHGFAGADKAAVLAALKQDRRGLDGPARCVLVATDASLEAVRARAIAHLETGVPAGRGVFFRARPIGGEIAFAFAGAGASYRGMGRDLLLHLPQLHDALRARSQRLAMALDWSFIASESAPSVFEQLCGSSALSQLHLALSEGLLGLKADAWLGYSSGETNALIAAGVWNDPDALMDDMEASGLLERELAGRFDVLAQAWGEPAAWECWTVAAPLDEVRRALAGLDRVHIAIINDDASCLIAGAAVQCAGVVERIGAARCLHLDYSLVVHAPELRGVEQAWLDVHRRATSAARHGRIYSTASGRSYAPDSEACAQAILAQAVDTIDIRRLVENAWNDGVRVFVEHGPGGTFGRAIRHVLGTRDALVVSLDRQGDGIETVLGAAAALLAAGVAVDHAALQAALAPVPGYEPRRPRRFDAHPQPVHLPPREEAVQTMVPAPRLPAVLDSIFGIMIAESPIPENVIPGQVAPEPAAAARPVAAPARIASLHLASPATRATHPALEGIRAELARVAAAQQAFTEAQTRAHAQFLALQGRATEALLRAGRQGAYALAAPLQPFSQARESGGSAAAIQAQSRSTSAVAEGLRRGSALPPHPNPLRPVGRSGASEPAVLSDAPLTPQASLGERECTTQHAVRFTREDLMIHADGNISQIFGAPFAAQDGFPRQVRMPRPPLLLADRVTALDAEPMSMGKGSITTQTDIGAEPWYLHQGRMPGGVMVEAGQADLMLISWLGVDALNRSERVYRLLGCELTYHGELPRAGETITFDIHLDGHAAQGDVRLMFFHYDCRNGDRKQLTVRNGQAGFFTDAELAGSAGCLWTPEAQEIVANPRLDPPRAVSTRTCFDRAALEAFASGDAHACFGAGFELARTHTRSPRIQSGDMLLLDRVTTCEPRGGPWGRGYLRAELDIDPSRWFFDGHFKNDPCMPGTLMLEGCLQALAFHLAACGYTLEHDGARFEPVPELAYKLQCRGQVIPSSRLLVTEVFVEEITAGPVPTIWADLLCTVDGLKAFHARRLALRLVADFPLVDNAATDSAALDSAALDGNGLLASALGRPSRAFGPLYERFDGTLRAPRLPAPPYLCISRIAQVDGVQGEMRAGARVVAEYEVPHDAWYLDAAGVAPFAILQEAALQPCGWLSSWAGCALASEEELRFRNLDGRGTQHSELRGGETLSTQATLTSVSASGGMIIVAFDVHCTVGARAVYTLKTVFGFFPRAALAAQAGLPRSELHEALLRREPNAEHVLDDTSMLRMIDRIDGSWPDAIRARKRVDAGEWFFKAHFFQDPVQPGSLGVQAMLQTLEQWLRMTHGASAGIVAPLLGHEHTWKYRGQVLPQHGEVVITVQVTEAGSDQAIANASLWVDGERIYEAGGIGIRLR